MAEAYPTCGQACRDKPPDGQPDTSGPRVRPRLGGLFPQRSEYPHDVAGRGRTEPVERNLRPLLPTAGKAPDDGPLPSSTHLAALS